MLSYVQLQGKTKVILCIYFIFVCPSLIEIQFNGVNSKKALPIYNGVEN